MTTLADAGGSGPPPPPLDSPPAPALIAADRSQPVNPSLSASAALYSVRGELSGATVLLTGATGYVGSLVLEQLLRTTDVARVYALMRGRRGATPQQRLQGVLAGPLFHLLRGRPSLAAKVVAVEGDMDSEGLGLSEEDRARLARDVEVFIHCAADIRLEVDVQTTLRSNYEGTRKVLALAAEAHERGRLRAHVHVSSAFVNMNRPRNTSVAERIYPMRHGAEAGADAGLAAVAATGGGGGGGPSSSEAGAAAASLHRSASMASASAAAADAGPGSSATGPAPELDCEQLVAELMALPPAAAEARAEVLCALWDFANNYVLGKHLAEQLVARRYREGALPPHGTAIVRPSLVAAVAQAPHPGYCGNFAGPIGGVAAMVTGLYGPLDGIASRPLGVWDMIPGDVVATIIVSAAAAASAGATGIIARAAQAAREGRCDTVAEALLEASGRGGGNNGNGGSSNNGGNSGPPSLSVSGAAGSRSTARIVTPGQQSRPGGLADAAAAGAGSHGAGSNSFDSVATPPPAASPDSSRPESPRRGGAGATGTLARLYSCTSLLGASSSSAAAAGGRSNNGGAAGAGGGKAGSGGAGAANASAPAPPAGKLLILHACTSSTYPVTLMEAWNVAAEFITAHPPPFSLRGRKSVIPRMPPSFEPCLDRVRRTDKKTGAKVAAVCALLRLFGDRRGAAKLSAGFASIIVQNNGRTDRSLTFETHGLLALEAALAPEERAQRMMVWRPGPAPADALALSESYLSAPVDASSPSAAAPAPVVPPSELPPVSWRDFLLTQAAGVYGTMFKRAMPREADAAAELRRRQKQAWWRRPLGVAGAPESWSAKRIEAGQAVVDRAWSAASSMGHIRHNFVLVKPLKTSA